jgi:riboflavin kinase/FMN adenylyltransferase
MKLLEKTGDFKKGHEGSAVTIGVFDGVHLGHQRVISRCVEISEQKHAPSIVLTFERNPRELIDGVHPCVVAAPSLKLRILESLGADYTIMASFDRSFASMTPEGFASRLLSRDLGARWVCVGENFRFGAGGKGDARELSRLGVELGFEVVVVPLLTDDGRQLSSTLIRGLIRDGEMDEVHRCLGRPYTVTGKVIEGRSRGKRLGFPTANLELERDFCVPADGVYAGKAVIGDEKFLAAVNIGSNPTFKDAENAVEVFVLDFEREIYGESLEVEFHYRLREEIAFKNENELIRQMKEDVKRAESLL